MYLSRYAGLRSGTRVVQFYIPRLRRRAGELWTITRRGVDTRGLSLRKVSPLRPSRGNYPSRSLTDGS